MRILFVLALVLASTSILADDRKPFAECTHSSLIEKAKCVDRVISEEVEKRDQECMKKVSAGGRGVKSAMLYSCAEETNKVQNHYKDVDTIIEKEKFAQTFLKGDDFTKFCKVAKGKEVIKEADCIKELKGAQLGKTEVEFCKGEYDPGLHAMCLVGIANKQFLLKDLVKCTEALGGVPRGICLDRYLQIPIASTPVKEIKPCPTYIKGQFIQCKEGKYVFFPTETTSKVNLGEQERFSDTGSADNSDRFMLKNYIVPMQEIRDPGQEKASRR